MKIKAVLFDLDGTLLDTLDDIADSANYALEASGYHAHPVSAYRYFVGQGAKNLVKSILPETERTPEKLASIGKIYSERYKGHSMDKTRPYDGVPEMLEELGKMPVKLAVVSNKPDRDTKSAITLAFGPGFFDSVAGGRDGVPLKPDPAAVFNVLGEFGISPEEAVFVGDTAVDTMTARNAGCAFVGVSWGFRPEELSGGDGFVMNFPSELTDWVRLRI